MGVTDSQGLGHHAWTHERMLRPPLLPRRGAVSHEDTHVQIHTVELTHLCHVRGNQALHGV